MGSSDPLKRLARVSRIELVPENSTKGEGDDEGIPSMRWTGRKVRDPFQAHVVFEALRGSSDESGGRGRASRLLDQVSDWNKHADLRLAEVFTGGAGVHLTTRLKHGTARLGREPLAPAQIRGGLPAARRRRLVGSEPA